MHMKGCFILCVFFMMFASYGYGAETIRLPCEVMESSESINCSMEKLNGVRYALIHQANAADRERFSNWLKANSGAEVVIVADENRYKAVLFRMPHCFGRGLLIHFADNTVINRKDIIGVILPK